MKSERRGRREGGIIQMYGQYSPGNKRKRKYRGSRERATIYIHIGRRDGREWKGSVCLLCHILISSSRSLPPLFLSPPSCFDFSIFHPISSSFFPFLVYMRVFVFLSLSLARVRMQLRIKARPLQKSQKRSNTCFSAKKEGALFRILLLGRPRPDSF